MSITVPPVPYKIPVIDKTGILSKAWAAWFRQLIERIGGSVALSNQELEDLFDVDLSTIQSNIATLQSQVATLQTQVFSLDQGPNL